MAVAGLTEALNQYQDLKAAENTALEEMAIKAEQLESDASEAEIQAAVNAVSGESREDLLADAEAAVTTAQKALETEKAELATARSNNTDAELDQAVADAQDLVNADTEAREAQVELQDARSDVADHVADNGSDAAVAKALYDAIKAYQEEGGTLPGTAFDGFVSAYNTELEETDVDERDFSGVLSGNIKSSVVSINTDGEAEFDLVELSGATAELRSALRDASKVAGVREDLNAEVVAKLGTFEGAGTAVETGDATAAEVELDLSGIDFSANGTPSVTLSVDGAAVTVNGFDNTTTAQDIADAIDATSEASATLDGNMLTVTSATTGVASKVDVTVDQDGSNTNEVTNSATGSDAPTEFPGKILTNAQDVVETREADIKAVADAEEDLAEAQTYLDELTALVDAYFDASDDTADALEALEDNFGIEALVALEDGDIVGTDDSDELFVYAQDEDGLDATVSFEAGDQLYVGDSFVRGEDFEAGNDSALEVFMVQRGQNTEVRIEQTAFGSSAETPEVDTITLTGVNAEDLTFADGYISVA